MKLNLTHNRGQLARVLVRVTPDITLDCHFSYLFPRHEGVASALWAPALHPDMVYLARLTDMSLPLALIPWRTKLVVRT